MTVSTGVTVTARVVGEVSSMATTVATSTPDVGWWGQVIHWFVSIFT